MKIRIWSQGSIREFFGNLGVFDLKYDWTRIDEQLVHDQQHDLNFEEALFPP